MTVSHPSMRTTRPGPNKKEPEVYVVENATSKPQMSAKEDILSANENAVVQKAEEKQQNDAVTNMLEDLLFLGSAKKEIEIGKFKFEISTLTQEESAELMKELYKAQDGADLFTIRALTLAYAVKFINGVAFDDFPVGNQEFSTSLDMKLYLIGKMQKNVVEKLHEEYVALVDKSENILSGEELKN